MHDKSEICPKSY
jgi:hypothetical protein